MCCHLDLLIRFAGMIPEPADRGNPFISNAAAALRRPTTNGVATVDDDPAWPIAVDALFAPLTSPGGA